MFCKKKKKKYTTNLLPTTTSFRLPLMSKLKQSIHFEHIVMHDLLYMYCNYLIKY